MPNPIFLVIDFSSRSPDPMILVFDVGPDVVFFFGIKLDPSG